MTTLVNRRDATNMSARVRKELELPFHALCVVGSVRIVGAGKDIDMLALGPHEEKLHKAGFVCDVADEGYGDTFASYRREPVNLLVTHDPLYYLTEVTAAVSAGIQHVRGFDLNTREHRVAFHAAMRDVVAPYANHVRRVLG